jgi:archaellum biogenesis ATPase FlaH
MQFNKDRTDNIGYLGPSFQLKVLLELLTDSKFSENVLQYLHSKYFDDDSHKRLLIEIKNYHEKYERPPSLKNNSIYEIINEKIPDEIEREVLTKILDKLKVVYKNRKIGKIPDDGEVTQQKVWLFIKQQEYKGLGQYIIKKTVEGNLEDIEVIESKIQVIHKIGPDDDTGVDVFSEIDDTLEPDFRNTIPTGLGQEIDDLMGGGLGNGEMGFILAGLGTGKTSALTKIANHAHSLGKNVLQIFFEDNKKQIKRKHYAIWSGVAQSEIDNNINIVKENVLNIKKNHQNKLILVKFPQDDNITVPFLKRWILNYQKVFNIKFDIVVLDYIDCVESHEKNNNSDTLSNELKVVKAFEAMLAELNIPGWSAIQGNRNSLGAEVVTTNQMGGNIKKAQKTHFLMSIARSDEQKEKGLANIKILKSRFGRDGILFEDCLFNNDTLQINIRRDFNPMQHFANNFQNNPVLSRPVITDEDDAEMKKTVLGLS